MPQSHSVTHTLSRDQIAGFVPVGVTNASEDVKQLAAAMNLPYFISTRLSSGPSHTTATSAAAPSSQQQQSPPQTDSLELEATVELERVAASASETSPVSPAALSSTSGLPPLVVTASVRSGQQIFAQNRSLVVLGNVNSGAEVLADEDVLVLGALKGRALAGIGGNVSARIICQSFDAELISIAHHFTTCDALEEHKQRDLRMHKPTVVQLQDDQLTFQSSAK